MLLIHRLENEFLDLQKRHSLEKAERLNLQKEKRDLDGRLDDKTQAEKLLQQVGTRQCRDDSGRDLTSVTLS